MLTEQETIERTILGKRIVAVSWLPPISLGGAFELESITLEGGTRLNLWASDWEKVVAEIEEDKDANT